MSRMNVFQRIEAINFRQNQATADAHARCKKFLLIFQYLRASFQLKEFQKHVSSVIQITIQIHH